MAIQLVEICVAMDAPDDLIGRAMTTAPVAPGVEKQVAILDALLLDGWAIIHKAAFQRDKMQFMSMLLFKDTRRKIADVDASMDAGLGMYTLPLNQAVGDKISDEMLQMLKDMPINNRGFPNPVVKD